MLNSMTRYYTVLSPFSNLNYKLESFDSVCIGSGDVGSYLEHDHTTDEKFKEIPECTWKENYDDILLHSLGLKKHVTEFDSKTTRYIAKSFLDEHFKVRNRGELATVRELFLHKFLFDAIFPMVLLPSVRDAEFNNPLLKQDCKIIEKKLYFIETCIQSDSWFNTKEMRKGLMFRISYLAPHDGLVHYQFYGNIETDRSLKFLIDVEESSLIPEIIPTNIHENLRIFKNFETVRIAHLDSMMKEEIDNYLNVLETLLSKKFGNIYLAELFCKYWYSINLLEDPLPVSFSDDNPFWFLDILSKRKFINSIERKFLNTLSISCVSILKMCEYCNKDRITLDSLNFEYEQTREEVKKQKKQKKQIRKQSDQMNPEFKQVIQLNSKLESTFNLSVPNCWNNRGISITRRNEEVILVGLLSNGEGIIKFEMNLYSVNGLFTFIK